MKRFSILLTAIAILSLSVPAFAGDGHACTASSQECLNKLATKAAKMGYSGLDGDYDRESHTWTVSAVTAGAPAAEAGFQVGDVIWGANGKAFADYDEAAWKKFEKTQVAGNTVTYNVKRGYDKQDIAVTMIEMPEAEVAKFIGKHMIEHAQVASNESM